MNAEQVLTRLNINCSSVATAVQQVRFLVERAADPLAAAKAIFVQITHPDTEFDFDDPNEARLIVANLVQHAIKQGEGYDPNTALTNATKWLKQYRIANPWAFTRDEAYSAVPTKTETRHDVSVQVKEDGSLKKGAKQLLAQALYDKNKGLDNKQLVELFMKELDMSQAGARTYVYNCKKSKG